MNRSIGAGFGLVAFMIAIALSLWMWASYTKEVAHYGTQAEKQARQYAGRDDRGRPAVKSINVVPEEQNGRLKHLLVDTVEPGGTYENYYHLQPNDAIIAIGPMGEVRDQDAEMAYALLSEAYQRTWELTIIRGGKKIVLPEGRVLDDGSSLANQVTVAPAPSTQPAKTAQDERVVPKELGPLRGIIR